MSIIATLINKLKHMHYLYWELQQGVALHESTD